MPRHFTPADRAAIRAQLLTIGLDHFCRYGLTGMRVDDVCREVGVSKGTFYNFFEHKEALFLAIAEDRDRLHREDILAFFSRCEGSAADQLGRFFDMMVEKILADPLLAIVAVPEDYAALVRRIPPERIAEEERKDLAFTADFCACLCEKGVIGPTADPRDAAGVMVLLGCLIVQKRLLTPDQFATGCALLRETFVQKLTAGVH